jgi:TM2 domain-containing membrane protein YozV
MDELLLQRDLDPDQRMLFQSEMSRVRKDPTVALLLCLFLGGLGAHQFYMGNVLTGVLYLLFCWTLIPTIVAFVELFLITQRVRRYNEQRAREVWHRVKMFPQLPRNNPDPL